VTLKDVYVYSQQIMLQGYVKFLTGFLLLSREERPLQDFLRVWCGVLFWLGGFGACFFLLGVGFVFVGGGGGGGLVGGGGWGVLVWGGGVVGVWLFGFVGLFVCEFGV